MLFNIYFEIVAVAMSSVIILFSGDLSPTAFCVVLLSIAILCYGIIAAETLSKWGQRIHGRTIASLC